MAACDWCGREEGEHKGPCPDDALDLIRPAWARRVAQTLLEHYRESKAHENGKGHVTPASVVFGLLPDLEVGEGEDPVDVLRDLLIEAAEDGEAMRHVEVALVHGVVLDDPHPFAQAIRRLQEAAPADAEVTAAALRDLDYGDPDEAVLSGGSAQPGAPEARVAPLPPPGRAQCPVCSGTGSVAGFTCLICEGWGAVEVTAAPPGQPEKPSPEAGA